MSLVRKGKLVTVNDSFLVHVAPPFINLKFRSYSPDAIFTVLSEPRMIVRERNGVSIELEVVNLFAHDGAVLADIAIDLMQVVS